MSARVIAIALVLGALGCRGEPDRITVAAASGARTALPDLVRAFTRDNPGEVSLLLAGSGTLVDWIESGKDADVVILGDGENLARLERGRRLDGSTRTVVAAHRLVLVAVAPAPQVTFATLERLPPTQPIAIGNPQFSSAGIHARALFRRMGTWDDLRPRLLLRGDVAATLAAARRGQAAAAVVYDTDARGVEDLVVLDRSEAPPHPELAAAVVVSDGRGRQRAREFVAFLRSAEARRIWQAHGFEAAEGSR